MSSKPDYHRMRAPELRKLCIDRGILKCTENKKYIKSGELIALLEEFDKSQKKPLVITREDSPKEQQPLLKLYKKSQPGQPQVVSTPLDQLLPLDVARKLGIDTLRLERNTVIQQREHIIPSDQQRPIEIELAPEFINPTPKRRPRKDKRKLTLNQNINVSLIKQQKEKPIVDLISITLDQFSSELDNNPQFIEKFVHSIKKLLVYKYRFYDEKYDSTKKEFDRVQNKIEILKRNGATDKSIEDMFPMKDLYIGFLLQIEEIIQKIKIRFREINEKELKNNLKRAIEDPDFGFASIIGRENVKNSIASQLYAFSKNYKTFTNSFNNICFLGAAGTGKTAIAKVLSFVYSLCGILIFDTTKIVSRANLVAGYVGQTAMKTQSILMETLEGVLFIDEAYQLGVSPLIVDKKDFGSEAITEIVNFLDKYIGMNVVIVAGYPKEMMTNFFPSNEGLSRRFPYKIILENYSNEDLTDILIRFMENKLSKSIEDNIANYLYSLISKLRNEDDSIFVNQAGDMLNLGTSIVKVINSAYKIKWSKDDIEQNTPIIKQGFNDFLETKGYYIN
jgi:hypothetical protein